MAVNSNWAPFLSWEGISGSVDKNQLRTVVARYFVPTLSMAERWVPTDLLREVGLPIVRRQYSQEWGNGRLLEAGKDGAYNVSLTLEGIEDTGAEETGVQFDADGASSEETLAAHPELPFLKEKYNGVDEGNGLIWAENLIVGDEEIKNPLYGAKSYFNPGVTWTKTYCIKRPRPDLLRGLGKIETPPKAPNGYIPELFGRRNWLKIMAKPSLRGNCWKVTESWLMSGDGGWNEDVYR